MDNKQFVEVDLTEKATNEMHCFTGCQRAAGAPTGE